MSLVWNPQKIQWLYNLWQFGLRALRVVQLWTPKGSWCVLIWFQVDLLVFNWILFEQLKKSSGFVAYDNFVTKQNCNLKEVMQDVEKGLCVVYLCRHGKWAWRPSVTKNKGNIFYNVHIPITGHTWTKVYFWNFYWNRMIMLQILFLHQNPYKHLSSIVLMLWTTRDHSFILISSLGINMLFHVKW